MDNSKAAIMCKKHKQPVLYIHSLINSSYGTFICDRCKNEIGEAVFNLIKVNLYTVQEFLAQQNGNGEQTLLKNILATLTEKNLKMKEINQFTEEQCRAVETDFALILKTYLNNAEVAKKYLKDRIDGDFRRLTERYKFLVNNYKMVNQRFSSSSNTTASTGTNSKSIFESTKFDDPTLDIEAANLEDLIIKIIHKNAPINQLKNDTHNFSLDVDKIMNNSVAYRKNENSTKFFLDINKEFEKYVKEYFRKFKRFLENAKDGTPIGGPGMETKDSMYWDITMKNIDVSRISSKIPAGVNSSVDLNKSSESILNALNGAKPPRAIKNLQEFPKIANPLIDEAIKKYGPFSVKLDNPSYKGLPEIGPILLEDNSAYKGQWKDEKRIGRGQCLTGDGAYIDGYWSNDVPDNLCRIIHSNGDIYEGYVKDGAAHGKGVFITKNGYRYIGNWQNNVKSGNGEELCEDGSEYKGDFLCDRRHGKGELTFKNGGKYSGTFCDGHIEGNGTCIWRDGVKYEGEWSGNKRNGKGKYWFKNGDIYIGDFVNDFPHGLGKLVKTDGTAFTGCWKNGVVSGLMSYQIGSESTVVEAKADGNIIEIKEWK